jgi:hypothetical protein
MKPNFSTFWYGGEFSPMEMACLTSFTARGFELNLYGYSYPKTLPEGVTLRDASEIVDESMVHSYRWNGRVSLAHFSDYFRFRLFQHAKTIWIDTDVVLLNKDFQWPEGKRLIAKEDNNSVCSGILHITQDDPVLAEIVDAVKAMSGKEIAFGDSNTGILLNKYGREKLLAEADSRTQFYPVHYFDFWKVFLPETREECEQLCKNADMLHLWNNIIVDSGIWKKLGPPEGSYLHAVFAEAGLLRFFSDLYPEKVMRQIVKNYLCREGDDMGIFRLSRKILPSIKLAVDRNIRKDRRDIIQRWKSASAG